MNEAEDYRLMMTRGWHVVPAPAGLLCWIQWEDGSCDGPFVALAIATAMPSLTCEPRLTSEVRETKNGTKYRGWTVSEPPFLINGDADSAPQYAPAYILLGVDHEWDTPWFDMGAGKPAVLFRAPA